MAITINQEEWLKALEELQQSQPDVRGWTTEELSHHFGHSRAWVRANILIPMMRAGKLDTIRINIAKLDGSMGKIPAYAIKAAERKTKKP